MYSGKFETDCGWAPARCRRELPRGIPKSRRAGATPAVCSTCEQSQALLCRDKEERPRPTAEGMCAGETAQRGVSGMTTQQLIEGKE